MIYFNAEMIKNANIKQRTVSKDTDKTKSRVDEVWKSAKNADKLIAEKLTGMKRSAIYRVFKEGSVNGKIVLAISQVMNVDPFYLTGEIDDKSECTEEALLKFAADYGYDTLIKEYKSIKRKKQKEEAALAKDTETEEVSTSPAPIQATQNNADKQHPDEAPFQPEESQEATQNNTEEQHPDVHCCESVLIIPKQEPEQLLDEISSEIQELINNVSEDDLIMLMKAVLFKAKFSKSNAKKADELKKLLIF